MNEEMDRLHELIRDLENQNEKLKNGVTYTRILQLEKENNELRHRLNATYDFIHHQGNPDYYKNQKDWDGVVPETYTTGNTERLDLLTRKFGIDEYPLE